MNMKRYIGATALMLVLGAPAYGQQIDQYTFQIGDGSFFDQVQQNSGNSAISVGGPSAVAVTGQVANNQVNAIGPTAYVGLSDSFGINQGAGGGFSYTGPTLNGALGGAVTDLTINGEVDQFAVNTISASATGPALANVLAGGNQSATNAINLANIAPANGAVGTLSQAVGDAYVVSSNSMSATVQNGNATVQGSAGVTSDGQPIAGYQSAFGSLNTANVLMGAGLPASAYTPDADNNDAVLVPTVGLTVSQKLASDNDVTAINSAVANSIASGSSILDPAVRDIAQSSVIGVNQLGFSAATTTTGTGADAVTTVHASVANLDGSQNGTSPEGLDFTIGNTAAGYTGASDPEYNLFTNAAGNGIAVVSGVTQNANLGLNNVSGGAGVSIVLSNTQAPGAGFTQSVDGADQSISGPSGNVYDPVINGIAARTNTGSATISGVARTSASSPFTQSFANQQNSISTGGSLAGSATQVASNVSQPTDSINYYSGGYANAAIANASTGPATLTSVSQNMNQSLNTVSASGSAGLLLNQGATDVAMGNNNVQLAAGSTNSSITGAQQLGSLSVNVASLGMVAGGTISQASSDVSLVNSNVLGAEGFNATVSGFQQSTTAVNVIK